MSVRKVIGGVIQQARENVDASRPALHTEPSQAPPLTPPLHDDNTWNVGPAAQPPAPHDVEYRHDALYDDLIADRHLSKEQRQQGFVTEWNGLNTVKVAQNRKPESVEDVRQALADATRLGLKVSSSGARHSSGAQGLTENSMHLDMTRMRGVTYDTNPATNPGQTVHVKAGTNWLDVMKTLEKAGRSVAVKQEFANFTVGGSVSVNAMGRDFRFGPMGNTVESLDLMTADGQVVHATPDNEHADLFRHAIGGLGMFGVVLEVELQTVPNARYQQSFETVPTKDFDAWTRENVLPESSGVHIYSGAFSVGDGHFLQEVEANPWKMVPGDQVPDFRPEDENKVGTWFKQQLLNVARLGGKHGKEAFWWAYKNLLPLTTKKDGVRNDALTPPALLDKSTLDDHAQALDVSIVPRDQVPQFTEQVKALREKLGVNVFIGTIYPVKEDESAALRAVKQDSYVITLGLDFQRTDAEEEKAKAFYRGVAEIALDLGGSFYLTHQLPFTKDQVLRAYPELPRVLADKKRYDPDGLFDNVLVEKYGS